MILEKGLSGHIIKVLGIYFPLQVHQIKTKIQENYQKKVSTQAIHKTLRELLQEKILLKEHHEYQLHPDFIIKLDQEVLQLKKNYFLRPKSLFQIPKNTKKIFEVNSLFELDNLYNDVASEKKKEYPLHKEMYVQHAPHAWFALTNIGEEIRITNEILEYSKKFFTLVNGNTLLDQWIKKFYEIPRSHYKVRSVPIKKDENHQYAIIGNYILESFYPHEVALRINEMFQNTKTLSELYLQELIAIVNMPIKISFILHHNPHRAKSMREKILKEF